jgi:hypothetical protein
MNSMLEPKPQIFFNHIYRSKNGEEISFEQVGNKAIVRCNSGTYTLSLEMSKHLQANVLPLGFYTGEIMKYLTPLEEPSEEQEEN